MCFFSRRFGLKLFLRIQDVNMPWDVSKKSTCKSFIKISQITLKKGFHINTFIIYIYIYIHSGYDECIVNSYSDVAANLNKIFTLFKF